MISEDDLKYLKKAGCSEAVIQHSIAVAEQAIEIAGRVRKTVDHDLVKRGAVNHDIGRARTHGLEHAIAGAEIAKDLGLEENVVLIIERHIGAGIPQEEAITYGFPPKDYIPETTEEIIVAYADNLISHVTKMTFEAALEKYVSRLGRSHPGIHRFIQMHELVSSWMS